MAQKPKSDDPAATVVFGRFTRPRRPVADLPMPPVANPALTTVTATALDLSNKPKVWFVIGRGRVGKSTLIRWAAEVMDQQGGIAIVAAADPINRSLRLYRDDVAEPGSTDTVEVREWTKHLLHYVMEKRMSALIDLGGGSTTLSEILVEMPNLAEVLSSAGVEPVAVYVLGADPHDLVPLQMMEDAGFRPAATLIVCNERDGNRGRFDGVLNHPTFLAAVERGAVPVWMPRLSPDAVELCDDNHWRYHDVHSKAGPFAASAVQTWLRGMRENFAPVLSWLPDRP